MDVEQEQVLCRRYRRGSAPNDLAREYGIGAAQVYNILAKHGISINRMQRTLMKRRHAKLDEEGEQEVLRLHAKETNVLDIAKAVGRAPVVV